MLPLRHLQKEKSGVAHSVQRGAHHQRALIAMGSSVSALATYRDPADARGTKLNTIALMRPRTRRLRSCETRLKNFAGWFRNGFSSIIPECHLKRILTR